VRSTTFIYVLKDPTTEEIRYVGKADDPDLRLRRHLMDKGINRRTNWIKKLMASGNRPVVEIVDEVSIPEWKSWEVAYIQFYKDCGFDLVNTTLGGEGTNGHRHTTESCQKISKALTGRVFSEEHKKKISLSWTGRVVSDETRRKLSEKRKGRVISAETGRKISLAKLGKTHSLETRLKISKSGIGKHSASEEIRAKMSKGQQRRQEIIRLDFSIQNCMVSV